MALLQQQVKDQQNRYEAGTVPRFNVLQAEVQLANALPPLIQAQNAYRFRPISWFVFGNGLSEGHPSEVPFNVVGTLGYSPRRIDTDESIRVAIARNPSLKAQRQAILSNAANVNVQIAGWFPTINANAGYEFVNDLASQNISSNVGGWFFGATGTWNIWDGGLTYGNVMQAKAQLMQAKNNYDNGVRQIVLDVQQAISNLQQAQETLDSQTASVVQATEALRLSRERLDACRHAARRLNAQVQLLQAQTNVLQARFDYIAAMASYDLALSLDTQYVETFDDPLVRPSIHRRSIAPSEIASKRSPARKTRNPAPARFPKGRSDRANSGTRALHLEAKEKEDIRADRQVTETLLRASAVSGGATSWRSGPAAPAQRSSFRRLTHWPLCGRRSFQRCPGIDVVTDRETALTRLWLAHRQTADALGFSGMPFVLAEQVHGSGVARVDAPPLPRPPRTGLLLQAAALSRHLCRRLCGCLSCR